MDDPGDWNHNLHYGRAAVDALPSTATRLLDVGCGEGSLARRMAGPGRTVVGIDVDADQIAHARASGGNVEYILGDVLTTDLGEPFDAIVSVATLHHIGTRAGLRRLGELLAPGGTLVVIGLATSRAPHHLAADVLGVVVSRIMRRTGGRHYYEHSSPVMMPTESYGDVRHIAADELPGSTFRRRLMIRYELTWTAPATPSAAASLR